MSFTKAFIKDMTLIDWLIVIVCLIIGAFCVRVLIQANLSLDDLIDNALQIPLDERHN